MSYGRSVVSYTVSVAFYRSAVVFYGLSVAFYGEAVVSYVIAVVYYRISVVYYRAAVVSYRESVAFYGVSVGRYTAIKTCRKGLKRGFFVRFWLKFVPDTVALLGATSLLLFLPLAVVVHHISSWAVIYIMQIALKF